MQITSEIVRTPIDTTIPNLSMDYFKDNKTLLVEKGFTEHVSGTETRYGNVWYYKNDTIIGFCLEHYGEYTQYELNLLSHVIGSATVVYDIGANLGYHTLGFAHKAKHVYAFEPNNKNYKLLKLNTHGHNNITNFNVGCSNTSCDSMIEDFALDTPTNNGEMHTGVGSQPCKLVKLDDFIKEQKLLEPHVIKIDVEGHEYEVIQGLDHTIRNTLPVIFYEHMHGDKLPDIYDYLKSLHYTIYWFGAANYNHNNYKGNKNNYFNTNAGVLNAFAVPFHLNLKTNLPEIINRDDTYQDALERIKLANAKN